MGADPSRSEPTRTDPSRPEPTRAARADPSRPEPTRADPSRCESMAADPSRCERMQADASHCDGIAVSRSISCAELLLMLKISYYKWCPIVASRYSQIFGNPLLFSIYGIGPAQITKQYVYDKD